jgi:hypothetical protein
MADQLVLAAGAFCVVGTKIVDSRKA